MVTISSAMRSSFESFDRLVVSYGTWSQNILFILNITPGTPSLRPYHILSLTAYQTWVFHGNCRCTAYLNVRLAEKVGFDE
jgi:hypothetical protein